MVRRAVLADAGTLAEVHIKAWQHAYRDDFPPDFLASLDLERRAEWFRGQIKRGTKVMVSDEEGTAVGFCVVGPGEDQGWGEVYSIYVHPDAWGRGHGTRLLAAAEEALRNAGFDRGVLWVLASNERARVFYERQGWVLGKPIKIEEIGGVQVTEVRYEASFLVPDLRSPSQIDGSP